MGIITKILMMNLIGGVAISQMILTGEVTIR